nr:hypothetical protein [uncultured Cellulosilyticum sp.]
MNEQNSNKAANKSLLLRIITVLTIIIVTSCTTLGAISYNKSANLNS